MPGHPSGSVVCFSLNYPKIEEDKTSVWEGKEQDYEVKQLGLAAYVGGIPEDYFTGFDNDLKGIAPQTYNSETSPGPFDIVDYVDRQ